MNSPVAMLLPSLTPTLSEECPVEETPERRDSVWQEADRWQRQSSSASCAEEFAHMAGWKLMSKITFGVISHQVPPDARPPREKNRLLEIHGLMGSIGEQLALAWAAEQDVQRVEATSDRRSDIATTMLGRAHAELSGHFILGASHSLGNLVLRALLLDDAAVNVSASKGYKVSDFAPGLDTRKGWRTLNERFSKELQDIADKSSSASLSKLARIIKEYCASSAFTTLDGRRGMDYHRRRPQSVPHTAPREGTSGSDDTSIWITLVGSSIEPEADLKAVHAVAIDALKRLAGTMHELSMYIPRAIREMGIFDPFCFATPTSETADDGQACPSEADLETTAPPDAVAESDKKNEEVDS